MGFKWKDATVHANENLTLADEAAITALATAIEGDQPFNMKYRFAEFAIAAQIDGTPPVSWSGENGAGKPVNDAFNEWLALPRRFGHLWAAEMRIAEALTTQNPTLGELDEYLAELIESEKPRKPDPNGFLELDEDLLDDEDPDLKVMLPYSFDLCIDLFLAYRKGILAVAGGWLDQPRKYQRMIRYFTMRYNRVLREQELNSPADAETLNNYVAGGNPDLLGDSHSLDRLFGGS